jgi:uncharacterized membrane protein
MNAGEREVGGARAPSGGEPARSGSICYLFGILFPLVYEVEVARLALTFPSLLGLVAWIAPMAGAGRGKMFRLPIIGPLAKWFSKL